jgi:hypothetical protein
MASVAVPTGLPEPIIPPADVLVVLPDLSSEEADRAARMATLAVQTYLYPCPVPDPLPVPVYQAAMILATRAASVPTGVGGQIVGESIGSYSYRLAAPLSGADALVVGDQVAQLLEPWACKKTAYDVSVNPWACSGWPDDWWQRDIDNDWPICSP